MNPKAGTPRWPLWLKLLLGAAVLAFVWSPFLAMVVRLSGVNPRLAPTGAPINSPLPQAGDSGPVNQTTVP
jgi:hypothetical protein